MNSPMQDKSSLRKHYLDLLKKQRSEDRKTKSHKVALKLFKLRDIREAKTILFYASLPGEVDTFAMIVKGIQLKKRICLPILARDQRTMIPTLTQSVDNLENGIYGVPQPKRDVSLEVDSKDIDVVIVPGLSFDRRNNRLGRGAGYYDRFLKNLSSCTTTIGLAFDFQLTDRLPVDGHDVPVSCVIAN